MRLGALGFLVGNLIINYVGVCSTGVIFSLNSIPAVLLPSLKIDPVLLVRVCFIVKTHSDQDYWTLQSVQSP
jgi:hypothetical protein